MRILSMAVGFSRSVRRFAIALVLFFALCLVVRYHTRSFAQPGPEAKLYRTIGQVCHRIGLSSLSARFMQRSYTAEEQHLRSAIGSGKIVIITCPVPVRLGGVPAGFGDRVLHCATNNSVKVIMIRFPKGADAGKTCDVFIEQAPEAQVKAFLRSISDSEKQMTTQRIDYAELIAARARLAELRQRCKDKHPAVQEQIAKISELEKEQSK